MTAVTAAAAADKTGRLVDQLRTAALLYASRGWHVFPRWADLNLVFCTQLGTQLDAANVRRSFRAVARGAGLDAGRWTPRELRHSFVSLLSSSGTHIEDISHLVGHASTRVTEQVYRKELRPLLTKGARTMDVLFATRDEGQAPRPDDDSAAPGLAGQV